jgi:hypothetical protein
VTFNDIDGVIDTMIIDIGLEVGSFHVMPDYTDGMVDAMAVEVDEGAPFVFYPVEDLCSILSALSFITVGELAYAEKAALDIIEAEEKKIRRSRFKVYNGSKDS